MVVLEQVQVEWVSAYRTKLLTIVTCIQSFSLLSISQSITYLKFQKLFSMNN